MESLRASSPPIKLILITAITGVIVFLIVYLINHFSSSKKEKEDAKALSQDISLSENTVNALNEVDNKFRKSIQEALVKKYGEKVTPAQVKQFTTVDLLPNKANYGKFAKQINEAYHSVKSNDVAKIKDVFKQLKSQFEVNAFATDYGAITTRDSFKPFLGKSSLAGDLYSALDELMHDSDLSTLRQSINSKPLI